MQPLKNFGLRIGIHIHERVAANQQIKARDGRILHQIVAAKN